MIKEYQAFIEAFKIGKSIKNAAQAKQYQNAGNLIGQLLISLAVISQAFGYHIPVSDDDLQVRRLDSNEPISRTFARIKKPCW